MVDREVHMVKKIIKGVLMSIILLIVATIVSSLIELLQTFCPILFTVFFGAIVLATGFSFADNIWK